VSIITFRCEAYSDIVMLGDVAIRLLKLMGHSGTVPGAILAKDVLAALGQLRNAVGSNGDKLPADATKGVKDNELDADTVSLAHRALPLIGLLTAAAAAKCNVMWDK